MICVPIKSARKGKVLLDVTKAQKIGDMVEVWFDEIDDLDDRFLGKTFSLCKKPIIYKYGGIAANLEKVLAFKPDFMDLDINSSAKLIGKIKTICPKTQVILSFHDFKKTPDVATLKRLADKMVQKNADIIKIATYANTLEDSLKMMSFLSFLRNKHAKVICLCMGKKGEITRKTGHLLGNYLMYAPIKADGKTAPGQISAVELKKIQQLCH